MKKDNKKLLSLLETCEPDIILLTGDLVDSRNTDIEIAISFSEKAVAIAPTYYVSGNHEARIDEYEDIFTILLSHRPELFDAYVECKADLVFSGHAHGGQFRLPFIGGIVALNQGLFPEYDEGQFTEGSTDMIVSRGIGNSSLPFRINNRPEIVLVELKSRELE